MNRGLSCFGGEHISFDTDDITNVQKFFPNGLKKGFVVPGANIILLDVDLDLTDTVLYHRKICLAHITYAHDAAGNTYIGKQIFVRLSVVEVQAFIILFYINRSGVYRV